MDAILGTKPATQPPVIVDTLQDTSEIQEDASGPDRAEELRSNVSASEESSVPKSTPSPSPAAMKRSRKRKEKAENSVAEMLHKVTEYQFATEQKLLELEEKRFKLEEKQMEREAQLRREEREFQLRMMEMLVRRPTFYPNQPSMPYQASPPVPFPFGNSSTITHKLTFTKMKSSSYVYIYYSVNKTILWSYFIHRTPQIMFTLQYYDSVMNFNE